MKSEELQKIAIAALEDLKAKDIEVIEVGHFTSLFNIMIIASAESTRQTKALANHVREEVKAAGGTVYGVEGEQTGEWLLVDLGDVVVHIMQPAIREYYDLEGLWAESVWRPSKAGSAA
ncbi:MAG TPA: ribosome silencing factor [Nitrosomonas halophila]|nr:ribosome silencing factor [Nitrosomonas halophila]